MDYVIYAFLFGMLWFLFRLFKGRKEQQPPRKNSSVWVKKVNSSTSVVITSSDGKKIQYYYATVNGNPANTGKIYTDTVQKFNSTFTKSK